MENILIKIRLLNILLIPKGNKQVYIDKLVFYLYYLILFTYTNNMKKIILKINYVLKKYEVSIISASTSFYVIIALISLLSVIIQFYNYFSTFEDNVLVIKITEIINPIYNEYLKDLFSIFTINSFTPYIFISLIWSSSKILASYNKVCDMIYDKVKKRNYFAIRLTSFLMFMILFLIFIIEICSLVGAFYLVNKYFHNIVIYIIFDLFLTIFLIFSFIFLLYIYLPPIVMSFKKAWYGALIVSVILYFMFVLFLIFIQICEKINPNFGIVSLISISFLWIYLMNYIIVLGLIINKKRNEGESLIWE